MAGAMANNEKDSGTPWRGAAGSVGCWGETGQEGEHQVPEGATETRALRGWEALGEMPSRAPSAASTIGGWQAGVTAHPGFQVRT